MMTVCVTMTKKKKKFKAVLIVKPWDFKPCIQL